jgi:PAS domain S-box-containing protein
MFLEHARNFASLDLMHPKRLLEVDFGEEAVLTIDTNSQILFASIGVKKVFGYTPEELLMQPLSILIPKELQQAHANGLARYLETGKRHIPWTGVRLPAIRKDGSRFVAKLSFGEFSRQGRRIFTGFAPEEKL